MPIYEYCCSSCGERFEKLVRGSDEPTCPACGSDSLKRLFSTFGVKSGGRFTPSSGGSCGGCTSTSCSNCKSGG